MSLLIIAGGQEPPAFLTMYLATLQTLQVVLLAWIGGEQRASSRERLRRRAEEGQPEGS